MALAATGLLAVVILQASRSPAAAPARCSTRQLPHDRRGGAEKNLCNRPRFRVTRTVWQLTNPFSRGYNPNRARREIFHATTTFSGPP
jgi:hypothetical protein